MSREEEARRLGASGRKGLGGAEKRKKLRVEVLHGKQEMPVACARVSRTGKLRGFVTPTSFWHRAKHAGCGRVRSRQTFFGHVPVAVRQGQRRDAVATGENDTKDVQRGRVNISGFIDTVES
jgi:hypothetical protein